MQPLEYTLTQANPRILMGLNAPHSVEIFGTFGGATVTPYLYNRGKTDGKGTQVQLNGSNYSTTAADEYKADGQSIIYEATSASGITEIKIVVTPLLQPGS